ncbi:MAG: hypothetical protein EXR72_23670 [Myxococcales bacterium]|nr:hypothetical protein [Myxococcales bacterium]
MAIRDGTSSTTELLRDSRYHRAALTSDPKTVDLAAAVQKAATALKTRRDEHDEREDVRAEFLAVLVRTDFELDEKLRVVELETQAAVGKNREDPRYVATFHRGLSYVIALRGEDVALEVGAINKALMAHLPEIAKRHGKALDALAASTEAAETKWKQSAIDAGTAGVAEQLARGELVRQLQKNEGALISIYPGEKRRVCLAARVASSEPANALHLGATRGTPSPVPSCPANPSPPSRAAAARQELREEPNAGNLHVGICAGGIRQRVFLPRHPPPRCAIGTRVSAGRAAERAAVVRARAQALSERQRQRGAGTKE